MHTAWNNKRWRIWYCKWLKELFSMSLFWQALHVSQRSSKAIDIIYEWMKITNENFLHHLKKIYSEPYISIRVHMQRSFGFQARDLNILVILQSLFKDISTILLTSTQKWHDGIILGTIRLIMKACLENVIYLGCHRRRCLCACTISKLLFPSTLLVWLSACLFVYGLKRSILQAIWPNVDQIFCQINCANNTSEIRRRIGI